MPAISIVERIYAIQYTGNNSAEIDGLITDFVITSEGGGVLNFDSGGSSYSLPTNDWIRFAQGYVLNTHTTSGLNFIFVRNASYDDLLTFQDAIDESVRAVGVAEAPTLLASQSTVVSVDIVPAMPDSSYTPTAQMFAATGLLGSLSITGTSVVDTNTVNVTVQNSGLISIGGVKILVVVKD